MMAAPGWLIGANPSRFFYLTIWQNLTKPLTQSLVTWREWLGFEQSASTHVKFSGNSGSSLV